jgi:hypothetical protein
MAWIADVSKPHQIGGIKWLSIETHGRNGCLLYVIRDIDNPGFDHTFYQTMTAAKQNAENKFGVASSEWRLW